MVRFIETDSKMGIAGAGGEENEELVFNGYRVSVWKLIRLLEVMVVGCITLCAGVLAVWKTQHWGSN